MTQRHIIKLTKYVYLVSKDDQVYTFNLKNKKTMLVVSKDVLQERKVTGLNYTDTGEEITITIKTDEKTKP